MFFALVLGFITLAAFCVIWGVYISAQDIRNGVWNNRPGKPGKR